MTRIWVLSDLHVDYRPWAPPSPPPAHDVAVVAGDFGERLTERVLPALARTFTRRPLVYVPGNHDFWRTRVDRETPDARALAADLGIHLLVDGETVVLDGTRFVGATLWTDYKIHGNAMVSRAQAMHTMFDHKRISGPHGRFKPATAEWLHVTHRARIEEVLATPFDGPTVVVTHHPPHPVMLKDRRSTDWLDGSYASDLSDVLLGGHSPDLWISGHTHVSRDERIGRTRLVSNPRGYVSQARTGAVEPENPDFDPSMVVRVGADRL